MGKLQDLIEEKVQATLEAVVSLLEMYDEDLLEFTMSMPFGEKEYTVTVEDNKLKFSTILGGQVEYLNWEDFNEDGQEKIISALSNLTPQSAPSDENF